MPDQADDPVADDAPGHPRVGEADVAAGLAAVRAGGARAAVDGGRDPATVRLVAVSKTVPAEHILPALEAGHRLFGENYVQESVAKWPALRERFPDVELHLVGPLQSNTAREAVARFDVIHALDRLSLAAALAKEIARTGRAPKLLIQVNTGAEPQKGGVSPDQLATLLAECRDTHGLAIRRGPALGAFRPAGAARPRARPPDPLDGDERRLPGGDPGRGDARPGGDGDLRGADAAGLSLTRSAGASPGPTA